MQDREKVLREDIQAAINDSLGNRGGINAGGGGGGGGGGGADSGNHNGFVGGSLLDGVYDEAGQANSFASAVAAWRGNKSGDDLIDSDSQNQGSGGVGAGGGGGGGGTGDSLLNGEFDEAANAASFADALAEWRGKKNTMVQVIISV